MAILGFELCVRFLWGSLIILAFISRKETSERFLKVASYILLGFGVCAGVFLYWSFESAKIPTGLSPNPFLAHHGIQSVTSKLITLGSLVIGGMLYSRTYSRFGRIAGFLLFLLSPMFLFVDQNFSYFFNFTLSSLLLGSVFGGQYLGHWYLNVPGMHISELKRVIQILQIVVLSKSLEIVWSLWQWSNSLTSNIDPMGRPLGLNLSSTQSLLKINFENSDFAVAGSAWLGFGIFGIILMLGRILWGLIAPLILSYMVKKTVDIRSTQSATGILYALSVSVLFGEACALYLFYQLGIFL